MRTIYHPTIAGVTASVHDEAVESWKASGWRLTAPKTEPQPTTATPAGGTTDKETD